MTKRKGPKPPLETAPKAEEFKHFYFCLACGQLVDERRLGDVWHHEEDDHEPLPTP